jgi:hypothetical protein
MLLFGETTLRLQFGFILSRVKNKVKLTRQNKNGIIGNLHGMMMQQI